MVQISNRIQKPKKTAHELVEMLRDEKGVCFELMSEEEAESYLRRKNNYLRTASYRKNYDKHLTGDNKGKYINLDFACLTELSSLDMYFRSYILPMCIDIEHAIKVKVVSAIEENPNEDGYSICEEFLEENAYIKTSIEEKADSIFTGELIDKYFNLCYVFTRTKDGRDYIRTHILSCDCPVWVLVEIVGFNSLIKFIDFYNRKYPNSISIDPKILNPVRSLRNACAHNNCLLNNMRFRNTHPSPTISSYVKSIPTIAKEERKKKLTCRPLFEFTCLMYLYKTVVTENVRNRRLKELRNFVDTRLVEHIGYFASNQVISTSFDYIKKVVDNLV